jgi:hypothetical protein
MGPRYGNNKIISTQINLSFPSNLYFITSIRAIKGRINASSMAIFITHTL